MAGASQWAFTAALFTTLVVLTNATAMDSQIKRGRPNKFKWVRETQHGDKITAFNNIPLPGHLLLAVDAVAPASGGSATVKQPADPYDNNVTFYVGGSYQVWVARRPDRPF